MILILFLTMSLLSSQQPQAPLAGAAAAAVAEEEEETGCAQLAKQVLSRNSPEFLLIPDEKELNTFTTSRLRVIFDWSHIQAILNRSCVKTLMVEYGPQKDTSSSSDASFSRSSRNRGKRESVSGISQVSPPLGPDVSSFTVELADDCLTYSVHLLAAVDGEGQLVQSRRRKFWPAAHRAWIDAFSDAVVLSWPPLCSHKTKHWRLRVCNSSSGGDGNNRCDQDLELQGESTMHIPVSAPCSSMQLRLYEGSEDNSPVSNDDVDDDDDRLLWVFEGVRTLPTPDLDVVAGWTELRLNIRLQPECHGDKAVRHWRVTHCKHEGRSSIKEVMGQTKKKKKGEEEDGDDGSGDGLDDDDEEEEEQEQEDYYYYDESNDDDVDNDVTSHQPCVSTQHILTTSSSYVGMESVSIVGLERCSLYAIDLAPTDAKGEALQPAERYGTIHSTLCEETREKGGSAFWFEDEKTGDEEKRGEETEGSEAHDSHKDSPSYLYILLGSGAALLVILVATLSLAVWHTRRKRQQKQQQQQQQQRGFLRRRRSSAEVVNSNSTSASVSSSTASAEKLNGNGIGGKSREEDEEEDRALLTEKRY